MTLEAVVEWAHDGAAQRVQGVPVEHATKAPSGEPSPRFVSVVRVKGSYQLTAAA